MGNFVTTGSKISESKERAELGHSNGSSEDKSKANDTGPVEDYVMSEASSLLNTKQDSGDKFAVEEEEIDGEEENGFHAGDIVWGEGLSCHQWWPGKIYDSSDASDLALEQMRKGKLLVACFGNETVAWCSPSQLKPFLENFKEFSKMSGSRRFLGAVEEAVREIGQRVENLLVGDEALVSPVAVNSGMKEGVLVPGVSREIATSLVLENPGIVLQDFKRLARTVVSCSDLLEIEVLKRKISAFYRSKGRFDLAKCDEDRYIIGLEDKEDEYELNFEDSSCQRSLRRCSGLASQKRKYGDEVNKVDLADLLTIGSTTLRRRLSDASKIGNADLKQVEETSHGKSFSSRKRKNKSGLEDDDVDNDDDGSESNDSNQLEESEKKEDRGIELTVDLSTPSASLCKRLRVDVSSSVERSNGSGETIVQRGKRERKKSKYLSPEYVTDFSWSARKSKIESESGQISAAERMAKIAAEKAITFSRFGATAEEILDLIREVALSTRYSKEYGSSYDMIREFVFVYRSFTYHDGANNKVQKRNISDEKKQPEVKQQVKGEKEQTRNESNETVKKKKNKREVEKQLSPETRTRRGVMEIEYLKEKLEKMRALLDQSEGEITEELKMKLEDESRNLLDKISKMIVCSF